jgi:hypothetical protein
MERELLSQFVRKKETASNRLKRHARILMATILLVTGLRGSAGAKEEQNADPHQPVPRWRTEYPSAQDLLQSVQDAIPKESMEIKARINARSTQEREGSKVYAEVLLHSGAGLYSAVYTIVDAFGGTMEQLIVNREPDKPPRYRFRMGDPLQDADLPNLFSHIKSTDITWVDLSLSFLWWPGGETVGSEKIRNRFCYIIEMPVPDDGTSEVSALRLWIDPRIPMLIQAEGYDQDGNRTRRLRVDSFKKVQGIWLIKDINVQRFQSGGRSNLRITDLKVLMDQDEEAVTAPTAL